MPTVTAVTDFIWVQPTGLSTVTSVLNNDIGTPLHVSEVNGNSGDVGQQITLNSGAFLTLFTDGTFEFTPAYPSTSDSFSYKTTNGIDSSTATVNIYITAPSELYVAYQSAVGQADQIYANQIGAAAATRQTDITAARVAAQSAADQHYANYQLQVALASAQYAATQPTIEAAYQSELQAINATWQGFYDQAFSVYTAAIAPAQQIYDDAALAAELAYQNAVTAAELDYTVALAPYQTAWEQADAYFQANPQDPEAQSNLAQAQADLDAATTSLGAIRDSALINCHNVYQSDLAAAEQVYAAAAEPAQSAFDAAMMAPDQTRYTDDEAAWTVWLADQDAAYNVRMMAEYLAGLDYGNFLNVVLSDLTDAEGGIEIEFYLVGIAAWSTWQGAEGTAWDAYTTSMANIQGWPALEARILAPAPVEIPPVAPFPGLVEPEPPQVRPFGLALELRGGVLVIPTQYELESTATQTIVQRMGARLRALRDRLNFQRMNVAGVLSGDIFDTNVFEQFNNLQANQNEVLITINGIFNTPMDAQNVLNSIATFGANIPRVAVANGTHGILGGMDIVQIVTNELGRETIADLRAAVQIEIAAQALRNNGGQEQKIINVVAHSQGTEVFFRALNFLSPATKAMIRFVGVGGERFVPNDIGLNNARNYYFSDDLVPRGANATLLRRDYARAHQYAITRMPPIPRAPNVTAHNFVGSYSWMFAVEGMIRIPPGSRLIRYGNGLAFPFLDLIANRD